MDYLEITVNIDNIFLIIAHPKMQKITYIAHVKMHYGTIIRKVSIISKTDKR
jgi:hypothetical protein